MNKPTEAQQERLREADARLGMPVEEKKEDVAPVVSEAPPVVPVVPARPATPENGEVTTFWVDGQTGETQTMRTSQEFIDNYCTQWVSKYGNNPNAIHAGGPCDAYR